MVWQKGESGNPVGRPPKRQSLSYILKQAGEEVTNLKPGSPQKLEFNRIVAQYVWQGVVFGRFTFRDGTEVVFENPDDWMKLIRFLYERIDGIPRQAVEVSGPDEGAISLHLINRMLEKVYGDSNNDSE